MKVLIVTYYFPPVGGVGVQRVLKWIKYFPQFEIEPVVLTNQHGLGHIQDKSLLNLEYLEKIKIYRLGGKKLEKFHNLKKQGKLHSFHNILLLLRYMWSMDIYSSWFYEIKSDVLNIIEKEKIDCILTTSPPHSVHLFGKNIKDHFSVPWIMDLRDPMVTWPGRTGWLDLAIQKLIEPKFEKLFYRNSDFVVFVTKHMQQEALKRCTQLSRNKTIVIRNGYDSSDFKEASPTPFSSHGKFCITYTGRILHHHNAESFSLALHSLLRKELFSSQKIVIRLIGEISPDKRLLLNNFPPNFIEFIGTVGHKEAIQYQMAADLLLLLLPQDYRLPESQVLAGKVFEYIGSGKPIFAIASEGELADLIRENKFGYVADPGNQDEIEQTLLTAYQNWKQGINIVSSENREQFTRESQCETLSHIIKEVAG
jgi:glycosyltransferase involved in cell wall biosynthesis